MPTFFFRIRDGDVLIEDTEGEEFANVAEARAEAVHAAREMLAEKARNGGILDGQEIEIVDGSGNIVAVVLLKDELRLE
jgi:predicted molibdopterin-dependent oxidoreductase YjgC